MVTARELRQTVASYIEWAEADIDRWAQAAADKQAELDRALQAGVRDRGLEQKAEAMQAELETARELIRYWKRQAEAEAKDKGKHFDLWNVAQGQIKILEARIEDQDRIMSRLRREKDQAEGYIHDLDLALDAQAKQIDQQAQLWHSVDQAMPDPDVYVLCLVQCDYGPSGHYTAYHIAMWDSDESQTQGRAVWWADALGREIRPVSHWAELPDMP